MDERLYPADIDPAWRRWLPCGIAHLTVLPVPAGQRFRRSVWQDLVPWDEPVWCDPGDMEDWVDRMSEPGDDRVTVTAEARRLYDEAIRRRSVRIAQFATICTRAGLAVPHTVSGLFDFCVALGLMEVDGDGDPWILPCLDRNPLNVLPLTRAEAATESTAQWDDRVAVLGLMLTELASDGEGVTREVTVTLAALAAASAESAGRLRMAFGGLGEEFTFSTDPATVPVDQRFRLYVDWPRFLANHQRYHLAAPEHDL